MNIPRKRFRTEIVTTTIVKMVFSTIISTWCYWRPPIIPFGIEGREITRMPRRPTTYMF